MRIGNLTDLFTENALNRTTSVISRSLQRLSSGLRVNSPSDYVAAFSEAVKLDSSIRGYSQAILNLNDANGLLDTASSALGTQIELVQKMRELAVQASNGTLTTNDRANLNTEMQALYSEFQRITSTTQFNGTSLLDGSFGTQNLQVGAASGDTFAIQIPSLQSSAIFQKTIGTGTFQPVVTVATEQTSGAIPVVFADFNHDGKIDLLVNGGASGTETDIYLGNGNGTFTLKNTYSTTGRTVIVGDVNRDGIPDILQMNSTTGAVTELLGNGDGSFKPGIVEASMGGNAYTLNLGDFNHDGILDVAAVNSTAKTVSIALGNGDGSFATRTTYTIEAASYCYNILVGDVNGDGNPDIVGTEEGTSRIGIWLGNANGTFQSETTFASGATALSGDFKIADVNNDGKLDLVEIDGAVASKRAQVQLGNGDGTFKSAITTSAMTGSPSGVGLSDINGDGVLDLVVTATNGIQIFLGNGDGSFKSGTTFSTEVSSADPVFADVNGDGVSDLFINDNGATPSYLHEYIGNSQQVSAQPNLNLSSQLSAENLITILDSALSGLKSDQATLGSLHARIDEANLYSSLMVQNLGDAKSSAVDVDIADETSRLVRNQILQQAQVAALSQGNVNAEVVLKLLGSFS